MYDEPGAPRSGGGRRVPSSPAVAGGAVTGTRCAASAGRTRRYDPAQPGGGSPAWSPARASSRAVDSGYSSQKNRIAHGQRHIRILTNMHRESAGVSLRHDDRRFSSLKMGAMLGAPLPPRGAVILRRPGSCHSPRRRRPGSCRRSQRGPRAHRRQTRRRRPPADRYPQQRHRPQPRPRRLRPPG